MSAIIVVWWNGGYPCLQNIFTARFWVSKRWNRHLVFRTVIWGQSLYSTHGYVYEGIQDCASSLWSVSFLPRTLLVPLLGWRGDECEGEGTMPLWCLWRANQGCSKECHWVCGWSSPSPRPPALWQQECLQRVTHPVERNLINSEFCLGYSLFVIKTLKPNGRDHKINEDISIL